MKISQDSHTQLKLGHNGDIAGKLRATETKVNENLYQEAFLMPAYPSSLKGSQAILTLVSLTYHSLL